MAELPKPKTGSNAAGSPPLASIGFTTPAQNNAWKPRMATHFKPFSAEALLLENAAFKGYFEVDPKLQRILTYISNRDLEWLDRVFGFLHIPWEEWTGFRESMENLVNEAVDHVLANQKCEAGSRAEEIINE